MCEKKVSRRFSFFSTNFLKNGASLFSAWRSVRQGQNDQQHIRGKQKKKKKRENVRKVVLDGDAGRVGQLEAALGSVSRAGSDLSIGDSALGNRSAGLVDNKPVPRRKL